MKEKKVLIRLYQRKKAVDIYLETGETKKIVTYWNKLTIYWNSCKTFVPLGIFWMYNNYDHFHHTISLLIWVVSENSRRIHSHICLSTVNLWLYVSVLRQCVNASCVNDCITSIGTCHFLLKNSFWIWLPPPLDTLDPPHADSGVVGSFLLLSYNSKQWSKKETAEEGRKLAARLRGFGSSVSGWTRTIKHLSTFHIPQ